MFNDFKKEHVTQEGVCGFKYTPLLNNGVIIFSYEACDKKNKSIKENAYKDNLEL